MIVELPVTVGEELRSLAVRQNREVSALLEEAVRQYLEAEAITDLDAAAVAVTQEALVGELVIPAWRDGRG